MYGRWTYMAETCIVGACVAWCVHAGETATDAGGTHPTGMHSYLFFVFRIVIVSSVRVKPESDIGYSYVDSCFLINVGSCSIGLPCFYLLLFLLVGRKKAINKINKIQLYFHSKKFNLVKMLLGNKLYYR